MANNPQPTPDKGLVRRLMIFFALVFLAQGLGTNSGVLGQPLVYFLKTVLGWAPDHVTRFTAFLIIPWIIKPLYGFLSDRFPLFGYHRKSYLFGFNLLAVGSFVWLAGLTSAQAIWTALLLNGIGAAACSTITEAVLVENGNSLGMSGKFLNAQWLWASIASCIAALGGGWLAGHLGPQSAFHTAAWIGACAPIGVLIGVWFLIPEERNSTPVAKRQVPTMGSIFKNRTLWIAGAFLFLWNIVPSFGTPLYYRMTDELKFSQEFIGILGAIGAGGSVLGAFVYLWLAKRVNLKNLLYLSVALGVILNGSYLLFNNHVAAIIINLAGGIMGQVILVAILTVAAHVTPKKSEGFTYALLMSVVNLSGQAASNIGAWMYVHMFHSHITPVIIIATVATAATAIMVPWLKLGDTPSNELRKLFAGSPDTDEKAVIASAAGTGNRNGLPYTNGL